MRRATCAVLMCLGLAACGDQDLDELRKFIQESGQGLRGKVEPLPEVKPYEPFDYQAFDLHDPFTPRKIERPPGTGGPDTARPKEPLEAYPLENLRMVGTLEQKDQIFALIRTPDHSIYRVKAGNYMGQNYGQVTQISEAEIVLLEKVQDATGEWSDRESVLLLAEEEQKQ